MFRTVRNQVANLTCRKAHGGSNPSVSAIVNIMLMLVADFINATHVVDRVTRVIEPIWAKFGLDSYGRALELDHYGCITLSGRIIDSFSAREYFRTPNLEEPLEFYDLEDACFMYTKHFLSDRPIPYDWFDIQRQE